MGKLTTLHINLIGLGTALVLAAILFFVLIKPKNEEVDSARAKLTQTQTSGGTPDKVAGKKQELEKTKRQVAQTQADWAVNDAKYMPDLIRFGTTKDLLMTYEDRVITWPAHFGERLAAWYDAQRPSVSRLPGVEFPIDSFPTDPNAISQMSYLKFPRDRWQVQMEAKDFDSAMSHLERFNGLRKMGMPVIDSVALQGTSPNLLMTYTLALYVIPREEPPPSDPRISAGGGGGGTAGAAGGFGGPGNVGGPLAGGGLSGGPAGAGAPTRTAPSGVTGPATRGKGSEE